MSKNNDPQSKGDYKLLYLTRNYDKLARKETKSWHTGHKTRFGGLETYYLMHGSIDMLIHKKYNYKKSKNVLRYWGVLFEPIAKHYLIIKDNIKVYDFGPIPSTTLPLAYNTDGVFINKSDDDLWLLEIKCPSIREVNNKTKINEKYIYQIQTGMIVLPCTKCLYIDFNFKKCSIGDIEIEGKYDMKFHMSTEQTDQLKTLWYGLIYWKNKEPLQDKFICEKPTSVYTSIEHDILLTLQSFKTGYYIVFKCFYVDKRVVYKEESFIKYIESKMWEGYKHLMKRYYKEKELRDKHI